MAAILNDTQLATYRRDGFIVVEGVLTPAELGELRQTTDRLVDAAREVSEHTAVYDLEPSHSAADPRVLERN